MPNIRTLARSFNGGEVTPEFFGQLQDAKFQTGLALARNFEVLAHGPVQNRAGWAFVRATKDSGSKKSRMISYSYSTTQTFAIEMGAGYFRFHTNGATLLVSGAPAYNGATAYTPGNVVVSGGVNYYCILATTGNAPPNVTYWYAMPSGNIFEVPNSFAEADLFDIHYVQSQDVLTFVHPNYAPQELQRRGANYWTLVIESFVSDLAAPGSVVATATVATGAGLVAMFYKVTAIGATGIQESLASASATCTNNLLTSGNYNTITYAAVTGATRYNIYKQSNGLYGYIGQTDLLTFKDDNITADIAKTPPIANNPFVGSNNFPGAVSYFEQRKTYAGTLNLPQNLWLTQSGTELNLGYSIPTRDTDGIAFRIAAREANTIRHIVPLNQLILLTSSAEYRVTSVNSDALTPTSISVRPQSYVGASNVQPVIVNSNLIYAAARGGHVRELGYNWQQQSYVSGDLSLRAPHLFDGYNILDMAFAKSPQPIAWMPSSSGNLLGITYVPEQAIGAWHHHDSFTKAAQSLIESACVVAEGNEDVLYCIIQRVINGAVVRYVERKRSRLFTEKQDQYFVDAGASYDNPITITGITSANPVVVTAPAHGFSNGDPVDITKVVGMATIANGGVITSLINNTRAYVAAAAANTFALKDENGNNINGTTYPIYLNGGVVRKAISTITSGLSHLEGETVSILADGAVSPPQVVTGGALPSALEAPASRIHIGLPITADVQLLPMAFETAGYGQGRQKNVNKAWIRVSNSSGIFAGPSFDKLKEAKQRTTEPYGSPPILRSGEIPITLTPAWQDNGQVCIRQADPLALTIVAVEYEVSIGA